MNVFEGKVVSENIKIGIVAARFNEFITSKLLGGALDGLKTKMTLTLHGCRELLKSLLLQRKWLTAVNMTL